MANWLQIGRMDDWARLDTPMHRLDARAKAVVTLAFIVTVMSFPRYEVSALAPFLLFPVIVTSAGRLPAGALFKKLLVAAPFALAVGLFNPLLDRQPVTAVGAVTLTGGWLSFASLMLRFLLTAWAALALVACTGMFRLAAGLERLGVPRVLAVQLLMLHRYLFVVADEGARMARGVAARAGGRPNLHLRGYGSLLGHLLLRSMDRAERVHRAMVGRGFEGELRMRRPPPFRIADGCWIGGCLACFLAGRAWNLAAGLGRFVAGPTP